MNFLQACWDNRVHFFSAALGVVAALSAADEVYVFMPQKILMAAAAGFTMLIGHSLQSQHKANAAKIEDVK